MGRTVERGYGGRHRRLRKAWAPRVAAGVVPCRRCGGLILGAWDLGHDDHDRELPPAPEHRRCNRSAAAWRKNLGFRRLSPYDAAVERNVAWAERENEYWAEVERRAAERPRARIY